MQINIRKAVMQDIPGIHALVKQLAEYEKAPEEVTTTAEIYAQDFSDGRFEAFVAELEGEMIGMALYYWAYSTWKGKYIWLEDFVVREAYRRYGVGKLLFDAVLECCNTEGANLMRWQVLDWNTPAIRFYEKYHADYQREWLTYKIKTFTP